MKVLKDFEADNHLSAEKVSFLTPINMNTPAEEINRNLDILSDLDKNPHGQEEDMQLSQEQVQFLFQQLNNLQTREDAVKSLCNNFYYFEYAYDQSIILYLFNYFNPQSEFGTEGVRIAAILINGILKYRKRHHHHETVDSLLLISDFYNLIWPFFQNSPYIIEMFEHILEIQTRSRHKPSKSNSVYEFLKNHEIFEILNNSLTPENALLINILYFIDSLSLVSDSDQYIEPILQNVLLITLNSQNPEIWRLGFICLGSYSKCNADLAMIIFNNLQFIECFTNPPNSPEFLFYLMNFISRSLKNREKLESSYPGSKLHKYITQYKPMMLQFIYKVIQIDDLKNQSASICLFSDLMFGREMATFCIEQGFVQIFFNMMNLDFPFKLKVDIMKAICSIMSAADEKGVEFLIITGFFDLLDGYIDEIMTEIAHAVIDALENVNWYAEMNPERADWRNFIFDNHNVFECLEKASEGSYKEDEYNLDIDIQTHALSLIQRMYND